MLHGPNATYKPYKHLKRDSIVSSLSTMVCHEVWPNTVYSIPLDSWWIQLLSLDTPQGASIAALCYFWICGVQRAESAGILALVNPLWILLHLLSEPSLSIRLRISMSQADRAHTLPVYTDTNDLSLATAPPQPSTHGTNSICSKHQDSLPNHSTSIIL